MEDKTYSLNGKDMKFRFAEFSNDLKMLAFLVGELSVSARYFSTFANVNIGNCDDVAGTFGEGPGDIWKSWAYNKRLTIAKEVEKLKKQVSKQKVSEKTKRAVDTNLNH